MDGEVRNVDESTDFIVGASVLEMLPPQTCQIKLSILHKINVKLVIWLVYSSARKAQHFAPGGDWNKEGRAGYVYINR